MKHWVIVLDWANNGENGLQIIAVEHSFEAAQQHFQKAVEDERKIADGNNWQVYEDDNTTFDAGVATKINSYSKVLIRNTKEPDREAWLDLPFTEDELNECLESIGVIIDDDEETDTYDLLMMGESITKYEVVGHSSDVLEDKHFADLDTANELVERLEDIDEYDNELLFALMADGDELDEAIDTVEDGAATFYSEITLEDLAEQYVDEGVFSSEFLMKFIDFKALGEALADDGYTEVNDGVLRRDR